MVPPPPKRHWQKPLAARPRRDGRLVVFRAGFIAFAALLVVRLVMLQVFDHETYQALASGEHSIFRRLYPERGNVFVHDDKNNALVPIALNQSLAFIFADPRHVTDAKAAAAAIGAALKYDEAKIAELTERLGRTADPYEPIERGVSNVVAQEIAELKLPGIQQTDEPARLYPESSLGGHVIGFLGFAADGSRTGRYGIEGYFDQILTGAPGTLRSEKDISGRLIAIGNRTIDPAVNGADIVLTIDQTIQHVACAALNRQVLATKADGGSVIIMEPSTGRILAMCGSPDFDPNAYRSVSGVGTFNNPAIFGSYEPGSVFKAVTMGAALDAGAVTPSSTYEDTGEVKIDRFTIKNSDFLSHGLQTMTEALEKSLNTGMIFAMRKMGRKTFVDYVQRFGFGERTGIELDTESPGDLGKIDTNSEIYSATASFGQGISVTPLQIVAAYAAIANGGILKKPQIVDEIRHADGTVETRRSTDVRRVIETKTARLLSAMLVSVVEHGHGGKASVPGYYIAGKTGTAQVPLVDRAGYDPIKTIGSFAGFGPVEDPKFAMIVRIDNPKGVFWAETIAAPLFGEIASFLVQYLEIPPTRPIK